MFRTILFDLDGTLTDPGVGITNSVAFALRRFGIRVENPRTLDPFIGPPLTDSFREFFGFSDEDALRAVGYYREYFREKGIFENEVYPGVPELLAALKRHGCRVLLASAKPEEFARRILVHFGLAEYFDFAGGGSMDESRRDKADVIEYSLQNAGVTDRASCLMVGDRKHDILGARQTGMTSVGVLFGYGGRAELEAAGADYLAASPEEILSIVLNQKEEKP